jgi:hypothetical protein
MTPGQVYMIEDIVTQPIGGNGVIYIVILVCVPVICQLFRAKHKH